MIKLTINYEDFDGKRVDEDHYFHLSKSELIDMEAGSGEPISVRLTRAGQSGDGGQILTVFKELIAASYGQRVDGSGSQFYKDPDLTRKFMSSLAFDQLLEDLLTSTTNAVDFVNGLMPAGLAELAEKVNQNGVADLNKLAADAGLPPVKMTDISLPAVGPEISQSGLANPMTSDGKNVLAWAFREPTQNELDRMSKPQLQDVFRRKSSGWKPPAEIPA